MEKMNYFFDIEDLSNKRLEKYLRKDTDFFEKFIAWMKAVKIVRTTTAYNTFLKGIIALFKNKKVVLLDNFPIHDREKFAIKNSSPLTEKTVWGGISLKKVDVQKNYIEKLLVIDQYGALGFELHRRKYEKLKILEGLCMVLYCSHSDRNWKKGRIAIKFGAPGDTFEFLPNDEHGVLAPSKCVIQEKSTNDLDDLVYVFVASQFR